MNPSGFLLLVFVLTIWCGVNSEVIFYSHHTISPSRPEFLAIPKFARGDAPHWSPGHGHSYIDLSHLRLSTSCAGGFFGMSSVSSGCSNVTLDIVMFEEPTDKAWMDYWPDHEFCCTDEMSISGYCSNTNKLIIPSDLPGAFIRTLSVKPDTMLPLYADEAVSHHDIKSTGVYILFMAVCDPNSTPIKVDGKIESIDPYGYLPADLYQNLPFYGALSCMYSIVGITWLIMCAAYRDQIIPLQMWITGVLGLGMIETTVLFAHYLHWNEWGSPAVSLTLVGLIFGVLKRALSRMVVVLVALGYGVVRSIGEDFNRVVYLGGAYLVLSLAYTIATHMPSTAKLATTSEIDLLSLAVFLLAGIDTTFYVWIITSINNLLASLAARKQAVKYILYRNFRAVLFVSLFFTCIWALYGSVLTINDGHGDESNWQYRWTIDALWELTYFLVFVAIAVLWAPSKNSQRYAQSIELTTLEDDADWVNAGKTTDVVASNKGDDVDNEYGGRLNDEDDPFLGSGALDIATAIAKKT